MSSEEKKKKTTALVTGASGYAAGPLVRQLLETGRYNVRGTIRSVTNTSKVAHLKKLYAGIELFEADLLKPGSFDAAVKGCDVVFHVASPFQLSVNDPQKDLVDPAVNGTLNVLSAVDKSDSVKRVVVTSSVAAIARGQPEEYEYTEKDWNMLSTLENGAYPYSKVMAEKAAWEAAKGKKWSLSVICPSFILGPPESDRTDSVSVNTIKSLLEGSFTQTSSGFAFGCVHVDDIAKAHIEAAERPSAAGERFMCTSSSGVTQEEMCKMLEDSGQFESFPLEDNVFFPPKHRFRYNNAKVRKELGLELIPVKEAVVNMALQLIKLGIVRPEDEESDEDSMEDQPNELLNYRSTDSPMVSVRSATSVEYMRNQQSRRFSNRNATPGSTTPIQIQSTIKENTLEQQTSESDPIPNSYKSLNSPTQHLQPVALPKKKRSLKTNSKKKIIKFDQQTLIDLNYILLQTVSGMSKTGELSSKQRGYLKDLIVRANSQILHIAHSYFTHQNFHLFQSELVGLCKTGY